MEATLSKPALRPRLVIVWLLLLALIVGIALLQSHDRNRPDNDESVSGPRMLLPAPLAELGLIEIAYKGAFHRFERDAANGWFYHAHGPSNTNADANHQHVTNAKLTPIIERALRGFEAARIERRFPAGPNDADYGVNAPEIFILVYRKPSDPQPLLRYSVGKVAPDQLSRYVLAAGSPEVVTIANFHIDNLLNLINTVTAIIAQTPAADIAPR